LSSAAGTARGLRDRPLGKALALLAVLVAALLVSRSCGSSPKDVSQERAVQIARQEVAFEPDRAQVRYVKRGLQSKGFWAVSLVTLRPNGSVDRSAVVVIDARTGDVAEVQK